RGRPGDSRDAPRRSGIYLSQRWRVGCGWAGNGAVGAARRRQESKIGGGRSGILRPAGASNAAVRDQTIEEIRRLGFSPAGTALDDGRAGEICGVDAKTLPRRKDITRHAAYGS